MKRHEQRLIFTVCDKELTLLFNIFFLQIPFFDDVGAITLQYFDSLFQRDNLQKSQFYKSLPKILPKLPKVRIRNEMFFIRVS